MSELPRHLRSLPHLLAIAEAEIEDRTFLGRVALLAKLKRALRAERARGAARHWSYELARHTALFAVYRRERDAFRRDFRGDTPPPNAGQKPCSSIVSGPAPPATLGHKLINWIPKRLEQ
jgi:hypothetical protein